MPLRASSLTAFAPVRAAALPSEPATDEYVPGISPSQPQRAEPMYYTSAGIPSQYPTPWTSPPSQAEVDEYYRNRRLRESGIMQQAAMRLAQATPTADASILKAFAPGGAAPAPIETAPVMAPNGETDWTTIALIGGGVLALGAAAWFLMK